MLPKVRRITVFRVVLVGLVVLEAVEGFVAFRHDHPLLGGAFLLALLLTVAGALLTAVDR